MLRIYSLLFYLALPFILCRLYWRGRKLPAYRLNWRERLGIYPSQPPAGGIWVHAVSYGEAVAAELLIKQLLVLYPDTPITVTNMTPTGRERIQKSFGDHVFQYFVPYDTTDIVKRFLRHVQPKIVIIMETELWPNMLHQCAAQYIKIIIANARLSERSMRGYSKIASITKSMLQQVSIVIAQSEDDAKRFIKLGLPTERAMVSGSIKFDIVEPIEAMQQAILLRKTISTERPIWIAASTHPGEEEKVLMAHRKMLEQYPNALLILVPRHPDRFDAVANLCKQHTFNIARYSKKDRVTADTQLLLGDTMGDLFLYYATADVAFVGGSLAPIGGHNLLEPAAVGVASITGPHLDNFVEISQLLINAKAAFKVEDEQALATKVIELFQNDQLRKAAGEQGRKTLAQNRGALAKHLELIQQLLPYEYNHKTATNSQATV